MNTSTTYWLLTWKSTWKTEHVWNVQPNNDERGKTHHPCEEIYCRTKEDLHYVQGVMTARLRLLRILLGTFCIAKFTETRCFKQCGRPFERLDTLQNHLKLAICPRLRVTPFKCLHYPRRYVFETNLLKHEGRCKSDQQKLSLTKTKNT